LIIGATNKPWRLDGAFLRPGRFDDKIYVPLPDELARRRIMDIKLESVPMEEGINLDYFVDRTNGYNGADIDYFCEKAKEFANILLSGYIALKRFQERFIYYA
jgi:transitional endoplasmic reticulum ATPase